MNIISLILPGQMRFIGEEAYAENPAGYVYQETLAAYGGFNLFFPFTTSIAKPQPCNTFLTLSEYSEQNIQLLYSLQSVRKHYNDVITGRVLMDPVQKNAKIFEILVSDIILNSTFWCNGKVQEKEHNISNKT